MLKVIVSETINILTIQQQLQQSDYSIIFIHSSIHPFIRSVRSQSDRSKAMFIDRMQCNIIERVLSRNTKTPLYYYSVACVRHPNKPMFCPEERKNDFNKLRAKVTSISSNSISMIRCIKTNILTVNFDLLSVCVCSFNINVSFFASSLY